MENIGWDLINVLSPYLTKPARPIAGGILRAVGAACNAREVYVMILERWSTIHWDDAGDQELKRGFIETVDLGRVLAIGKCSRLVFVGVREWLID